MVKYRFVSTKEAEKYNKFILSYFESNTEVPIIVMVAEENMEIVGILSSIMREGRLIMGPLLVKRGYKMVQFRIVLLYEKYIKKLGIQRYFFRVKKGNTAWLRAVRKRCTMYRIEGDMWEWYFRIIP